MYDDPGFLALTLIFIVWTVLIVLGLLVGLWPRSWRQKPSGKIKSTKAWKWPSIPHRNQ